MPNSTSVYVPTSKDVVVKGFANATYLQRITLTVEGGSQFVLQGTGENNTPIGSQHFTTSADGGPDGEITIDVVIEYSPDGGSSWNAPDIYTDSCTIQAFNLVMVVAEDMADQDYNDAICMISWPGRDESARGETA